MDEERILRPAAHQVAGHEAGVGKVGPLVDGAGKFYKPLQDVERGEREKKFYEDLFANNDVPSNVKLFFPSYYGTRQLQGFNGAGFIEHIVLEDITCQYQRPCVIDLKMGLRTWYPGASEKYVAKCLEKDAESTSSDLGFRVSGLQVFDAGSGKTWKPGRLWCKMLNVDTTKILLKRFVSSNPTDDENPDGAYASAVYGGREGIINQLYELRSWLSVQTSYHFFASSILLMYDAESVARCSPVNTCASVKLVDFAHVLTNQEAVDENYLQGLNSLIDILREITGGY
ncbi:hypothetical protein KP509_25G053800 [Ceratopteris richardii]|uniref:Inositol polyphosphate multikinase n=1 Tax=Ceratopteris richardii TaxID=49495 RepID=A0A8T2RSQ3_CERRI|nr:hypothetical protein KP509_25G053800 [Ceratopteris richardii]KAH7298677.1 hypothetical protein KP509_25G053800 [Ceratopteris richardii]